MSFAVEKQGQSWKGRCFHVHLHGHCLSERVQERQNERERQTIAAEGLGRQQCTMWIHEDEESRSAEKAKVAGFVSGWTLGRQLADWLADGQGQAPDGRQPAESAAT